MRRKIHVATASQRAGIGEMSRVQKAGAQDSFDFQFSGEIKTAFGFRRKKGWLHRSETSEQRRIRKTVGLNSISKILFINRSSCSILAVCLL